MKYGIIFLSTHTNPTEPLYMYTYIHTFTDPLPAKVGLNVEFVMNRAKLQYAIKSKQYVKKLHKISKNVINNKEKIISTQQFKATCALQNNKTS
jgi:hypothetical protein